MLFSNASAGPGHIQCCGSQVLTCLDYEAEDRGLCQKKQTRAPAPKHDGLDPLAALAGGHAQAKRARVAGNERLPKLVAVVARAIGGIDQDLHKRCSAFTMHAMPDGATHTVSGRSSYD